MHNVLQCLGNSSFLDSCGFWVFFFFFAFSFQNKKEKKKNEERTLVFERSKGKNSVVSRGEKQNKQQKSKC